MADKKTQLSIVIATVDQATAKLKAINDRLDKITKPTRDFKKALGEFSEKSGLDGLASSFRDVGGAVEGVLTKLAVIGGVAGLAVHALFGVVKEFDDLGDTAERVGVSVDFLAQMRYAAEKAGAPVGALDEGLTAFNQNIGQLRANTGRLYKFLGTVSPELLKQVKAAKSNAEAFDLMAGAIAKLPDPARRAALAQKAFGDSALAPLLAKGADGVKALRDRYAQLAGSQQDAADKAGAVDDSLHDLKASTDGVKAALLEGLAPALKQIVDRLRDWFTAHREDVREWAAQLGEKIPGAIQSVVAWLGKAYDKVRSLVDVLGGLKGVAIAAGLIITGPLIVSLASLGVNLLKVIGRVGQLGGAFADAGSKAGGFGGALGAIPGIGTAIGIAAGLNEATGGSIEGGALGIAKRAYEAEHVGATPSAAGLIGPELRAKLFGGVQQTSAKVTIDVKNLPPGSRVTADPKNTAEVDLSAGYQLAGAM